MDLSFVFAVVDPEAGYLGSGTIRSSVTVSDDGASFAGLATIELPAAEGQPSGELGPVEVTAQRISVEPMGETVGPFPPEPVTADPRVIELEATAALQFRQDGERILDIPVTPGETVVIRIDNTAGFDHAFFIGSEEELMGPGAVTDVGTPPWKTGVQLVEWEVPADVSNLRFACTVPGHYTLMHGTFSVSP